MHVYISGETLATAAIAAVAAKELSLAGHTIYNPSDPTKSAKGTQGVPLLQTDLLWLMSADALVLLPSAWTNAQARAERAVAEALGTKKIKVLDLFNPADRKTLKLKPICP